MTRKSAREKRPSKGASEQSTCCYIKLCANSASVFDFSMI
jgi:hypothetical protein